MNNMRIKKLRVISVLFPMLLFIMLSACGSSGKDFRNAQWGMTLNEVVKLEENSGNKLYEEDTGSKGEITIEFEDIIINGYKADVEYTFNNQVKPFLIMRENDFKKLVESGDDIQESIKFNDFILTEGRYYFTGLDEKDSEDILDSLLSKYGEPTTKDDYYIWHVKRATIYFDGQNYVSYRASLNAMEKFGRENKGGKKNSNDL